MLVLKRRVGERIFIANGLIVITLVEGRTDAARIGIECPRDIPVHREEVQQVVERDGPKPQVLAKR